MSGRARLLVGVTSALVGLPLVAGGALLGGGGLEYVVPHEPRPCDHLLTGPPVVAHRGFSSVAPENTQSAFAAAVELGVAFELDVTLAATGEVVVLHDDTLERTTTGAGLVGEANLDTLRTLDAGSWFSPEFAGEPLPTLDEVLARHGGAVVIDIELKTTELKAELAAGVVELVRAHELEDEVLLSSFDPYILEQARLLAPELRRGQLLGTFEDADLSWPEKRVLQNLGLNAQAQPDILIGGDAFVTAEWVARQKQRGYTVMVYTINDAARMTQLREWGVDAIITDVPDQLLASLE
ncbi:cytoplasmic glycerophosphodiester phosphodiesterase [Plesiocystis pacifica SIR-1]|uniref:Cytoplasmic glycerophosphodiester phosphodiesterase n=1 Tax=Plesiocystis pacifica SIR-1 TaxID=391625 RepID=A6GHY7_9BACT|nr:glycerophosphodiester phosphodiesterase family protein [Plesiocystis pacifica]EDM74494.1 cytoplasmic glycerophosphodiester phosphodiesterase [Plesiocystis pacifica SIR-1]